MMVTRIVRLESAEGCEEFIAGCLAAPARLGADPAVLVHACVLFAFIAAGLAYGGAGLEHGAGDVGVIAGVAGEDAASCGADVRAVEVGADAFGQLGHHVLAQTSIGAGGTGLRAVETGGDAFGQLVLVNTAEVLRVGGEQCVSGLVGHFALSLPSVD
jgi:hypothetical protein